MIRAAVASLFLAAVAACSQPPTLSPDFGAAVRHNMAAQIVAPVPRDPSDPIAHDGARAQAAIERYRAGKVIAPEGLSTSDNVVAAPAR